MNGVGTCCWVGDKPGQKEATPLRQHPPPQNPCLSRASINPEADRCVHPHQMSCVTGWHVPEHTTPASSPWLQLLCPQGRARHWAMLSSLPMQLKSSSQMCPIPCPKRARLWAAMALPQPSCLHTTAASFRSQPSSQTVPHCPLWSTSTLPLQRFGPSARRTSATSALARSAGREADDAALRTRGLHVQGGLSGGNGWSANLGEMPSHGRTGGQILA